MWVSLPFQGPPLALSGAMRSRRRRFSLARFPFVREPFGVAGIRKSSLEKKGLWQGWSRAEGSEAAGRKKSPDQADFGRTVEKFYFRFI